MQRLAQSHGLGRHHVHQGAALNAGENLAVQRFGHVFGGEDHAAAGAAQGFVRGR